MYFGDYNDKNKNLNYSDKTNDNRDTFLKNLKKDKELKLINVTKLKSADKIKQRIRDIKKKIISADKIKEKLNNLNSVYKYISDNKIKLSLNNEKIIKIINVSFKKINNDLVDILKCYNVNNSIYGIQLIDKIFNLISLIKEDKESICVNTSNLINTYFDTFKLVYLTLYINMYYEICLKNNLIYNFNSNFTKLNLIICCFKKNDNYNIFINELSNNINYMFLSSKILVNFYKIIDNSIKTTLFTMLIDVAIFVKQTLIYTSIKYNFILNLISNSIDSFNKKDIKNIQEFNFIENLTLLMIKLRNFDNLKKIDSKYLNELVINFKYNSNNNSLIQLDYIINLLSCLSDKLKIEISLNTDQKQKLIKKICYLIEELLVMINHNVYTNDFKLKMQNKIIKLKVLLIASSLDVIYTIYSNTDSSCVSYSILDYIFNKSVSIKNRNIIEDILKFSVVYLNQEFIITITRNNLDKDYNYNLINNKIINKASINSVANCKKISSSNNSSKQDNTNNFNNKDDDIFIKSKFSNENIKVINIIAFFLDQQIQYKPDNFYNLLSRKKDIYENIPFNVLYLRTITKVLLKLFSNLVFNPMYNNILNSTTIIHCLKSLFYLDDKIGFSYNRELFWNTSDILAKNMCLELDEQLENINLMPFVYPVKYRINTFYESIFKESNKSLLSNYYDNNNNMLNLKIPRENMFDTCFNLYYENILDHKVPWKITFVNKFNIEEDGQDAGGLYNEFLIKLSEECFSVNIGYFIETNNGFLAPNPHSVNISEYHLKVYEFLGYITGISIYNQINIYPNFSVFFLNNVLNIENSFIELKEFDNELYKNLIALQEYEGNVENDFGLNFTVTEILGDKVVNEKELIPNGKSILVNNENKLLYIRKMAQFKLETQFKDQCNYFKIGLQKILSEDSYKLFTSDELRQIICGFDKEISVSEWKLSTEVCYFNMLDDKHVETINNFWYIVYNMDETEKQKLLFFVTSLKRPPLTGFSTLSPRFSLAYSDQQFPTASTCINQLKLPILEKEQLKKALLYAINADAGFYYA